MGWCGGGRARPGPRGTRAAAAASALHARARVGRAGAQAWRPRGAPRHQPQKCEGGQAQIHLIRSPQGGLCSPPPRAVPPAAAPVALPHVVEMCLWGGGRGWGWPKGGWEGRGGWRCIAPSPQQWGIEKVKLFFQGATSRRHAFGPCGPQQAQGGRGRKREAQGRGQGGMASKRKEGLLFPSPLFWWKQAFAFQPPPPPPLSPKRHSRGAGSAPRLALTPKEDPTSPPPARGGAKGTPFLASAAGERGPGAPWEPSAHPPQVTAITHTRPLCRASVCVIRSRKPGVVEFSLHAVCGAPTLPLRLPGAAPFSSPSPLPVHSPPLPTHQKGLRCLRACGRRLSQGQPSNP